MKRVLILLAVMGLIIPTAWAQTTKGSLALGGGLSYNSSKNLDEVTIESSQVQFSPNVGYLVADNLEIGLELGLSAGKTSFGGTDDFKTSSLSVGPYARYYKFTSNDRFAFTAQAGFSIGSGKSTPPNGNDTKTGSLGIYLSPGFTYFLSDKWGLDFQLQGISYNSNDPNKDVDDNNNSSFTFGVNSFNPSLGFRYYISK